VKFSRRTIAASVIGAIGIGVLVAACGPGTSAGQALENKASNNIEKTYLLNEPPPEFSYSAIRATAISIEAIQALNEQTTSFGFNMGEKNPVWSCPSLGEPVASDDEITNPDQAEQVTGGSDSGGNTAVTVGNMDPNGIYAGDSTGTYVLCVNASGTPYAEYWEGSVDTVSGPAVWNSKTGTIDVTGAPTMPKCTVANAGEKSAKTTCVK
jgi:hypothetical protein